MFAFLFVFVLFVCVWFSTFASLLLHKCLLLKRCEQVSSMFMIYLKHRSILPTDECVRQRFLYFVILIIHIARGCMS